MYHYTFRCGSERFNRESSDPSPISRETCKRKTWLRPSIKQVLIFTIAGPIAAPSIAAVMIVFAKLAQTGLDGTGLLFDAFASKLIRQVIPRLDPKSVDIAWIMPWLTHIFWIRREPSWRCWEYPWLPVQELRNPEPWCSGRGPTRTWNTFTQGCLGPQLPHLCKRRV